MSSSVTVVAPLTKVLLATLAPEFVSGETIRRMRGTLMVGASASSATAFHGAVGAYVASDAAVIVGITALLDPSTNVADDAWLWYQSFAGKPAGDGSAGALGTQLIEIDNKAMRRIETGFQVVFVAANPAAIGSLHLALSIRVLGSEAS